MSEIELGMQWANEWFDKRDFTLTRLLTNAAGTSDPAKDTKACFAFISHFHRITRPAPYGHPSEAFVEGALLIFALRQSELSEV